MKQKNCLKFKLLPHFLDILGTVQIWAFKNCFVEMTSTVCIILLYDNAFIIHFSIHTTWSTYNIIYIMLQELYIYIFRKWWKPGQPNLFFLFCCDIYIVILYEISCNKYLIWFYLIWCTITILKLIINLVNWQFGNLTNW